MVNNEDAKTYGKYDDKNTNHIAKGVHAGVQVHHPRQNSKKIGSVCGI